MIYNEEYVKIEKFLENTMNEDIKIQCCNFYTSIKDTLPKQYQEYPPLIRIGLRSKKVDKESQKQIKDWFKNILGLDKPYLEREFGSTSKEILYEIIYKPSEELFDKLKVLSRIN